MGDGHALVVAQAAKTQRQIRQVVEELGVEARETAAPNEAARLLDEGRAVLLIAQGTFDAPGDAGFFLRARRQRPPAPSIAIAERCDAQVLDFAARVGVVGLLSAPVGVHALCEKVQAALTVNRLTGGLGEMRETLHRWEEDLAQLEQRLLTRGRPAPDRDAGLCIRQRRLAGHVNRRASVGLRAEIVEKEKTHMDNVGEMKVSGDGGRFAGQRNPSRRNTLGIIGLYTRRRMAAVKCS